MAQSDDQIQQSDEYRQIIAEEVAKQWNQNQAAQGGTPGIQAQAQADGGIKVKLWGQEHAFNSAADMQAFMERYMDEAMKVAQQSAQPAQQQQPQATTPARPKIDVDKYVELLAKDPYEAERFKNQQIYGVDDPISVVAGQLRQLQQFNQQQYINSVTDQFKKATEDFPSSDPQAGIAVSATLQRLGMPLTVENLQAAWHHAKATGAYAPQQPQQYDLFNAPQSAPPSHTAPRPGIPSLSGGTSAA